MNISDYKYIENYIQNTNIRYWKVYFDKKINKPGIFWFGLIYDNKDKYVEENVSERFKQIVLDEVEKVFGQSCTFDLDSSAFIQFYVWLEKNELSIEFFDGGNTKYKEEEFDFEVELTEDEKDILVSYSSAFFQNFVDVSIYPKEEFDFSNVTAYFNHLYNHGKSDEDQNVEKEILSITHKVKKHFWEVAQKRVTEDLDGFNSFFYWAFRTFDNYDFIYQDRSQWKYYQDFDPSYEFVGNSLKVYGFIRKEKMNKLSC